MNEKEVSGKIKKCKCEICGKETICYEQGIITLITKRLLYEEWVCQKCID